MFLKNLNILIFGLRKKNHHVEGCESLVEKLTQK